MAGSEHNQEAFDLLGCQVKHMVSGKIGEVVCVTLSVHSEPLAHVDIGTAEGHLPLRCWELSAIEVYL